MGKKNKENPNHFMGKQTGYELVDGKYHIAPLHSGQFDYLADKEAGIKSMLNAVADHVAKDLEEITKARREVWKRLAEDIGLDMQKNWVYRNGVVEEVKQ